MSVTLHSPAHAPCGPFRDLLRLGFATQDDAATSIQHGVREDDGALVHRAAGGPYFLSFEGKEKAVTDYEAPRFDLRKVVDILRSFVHDSYPEERSDGTNQKRDLSPAEIMKLKIKTDVTDPGITNNDLMSDVDDNEHSSSGTKRIFIPTKRDNVGERILLLPRNVPDPKTLRVDEMNARPESCQRTLPTDEALRATSVDGRLDLEAAAEMDRREGVVRATSLWPKGIIPYKFSAEIESNSAQKNVIYAAMKDWMAKTCIRFEPNPESWIKELGHRQHVIFTADKIGCYSWIGMQPEKVTLNGVVKNNFPQEVSLQRNDANGVGCMHARTVMHEIGHLLGLRHEQNRLDRDTYVKVKTKNVQTGNLHNFAKEESEGDLARHTPYDYLSIMHYGKDAFGKLDSLGHRAVTMVPTKQCYLNLIGKARYVSFYDAQIINDMYGCTKDCSSDCGNTGYSTRTYDKPCHCEYLDTSNDDCNGGSCFAGDQSSYCSLYLSRNPGRYCFLNNECCESCAKANIPKYAECSVPDKWDNCKSLVVDQNLGSTYCANNECCWTCKYYKSCPNGDLNPACLSSYKQYGDALCAANPITCCKTCEKVLKK